MLKWEQRCNAVLIDIRTRRTTLTTTTTVRVCTRKKDHKLSGKKHRDVFGREWS